MGKSTGRSPPFSIREVQVQAHLLVRPDKYYVLFRITYG